MLTEGPANRQTAAPRYARIVVPLDGSILAEGVLPHVISLALQYDADVELVRSYTPPASLIAASAATSFPGTGPMLDPAPFIAASKCEAQDYLSRIAAELATRGVKSTARRLDGTAGESIVAEARRQHADLIVMSTHGRGGLGRLVLGSVADHVIHHAPCPVMLVRTT